MKMNQILSEQEFCLYATEFDDNAGFYQNGLWYSKIKINSESFRSFRDLKSMQSFGHMHVLCIPFERNSQHYYTCISEEWSYRSHANQFVMPKFSMSIENLFT